MTIVKNDDAIFDCIVHEANRQRLKHPDQVDAINVAEKKIRALVIGGKVDENLMLVEFTKALKRLRGPQISPRTRHNAIQYASE
ncbi:MAG TPA: hypothetical protein VGI45_05685 [Terracidiphilus sp.]|jgi:hypothetical protein